jgi:hypothetical protein
MRLEDVIQYCHQYNIPPEYFLEILNDQKVLPMIRGKASEYNSYLAIKNVLPPAEWVINKLNLNAQPNTADQDLSITHRRTGLQITVETKNAVRGSFRTGERARVCRSPHFKVKCHRSRSNISLAGTTNDRYSVDCFDVVVSNVSNAIIQGNTIGERLELLHDREALEVVRRHYAVEDDNLLLEAANNDWRFALSRQIAQNDFIPRTPYVMLSDDPNWHTLDSMETVLLDYLQEVRNRR